MKLTDSVKNELLSGSRLTPQDRELLVRSLGELVPPWFLELCADRDLAGTAFSLQEEDDLSGMGVELRWMTAAEMIDEAAHFYPGIVAIKHGFLPFGICLEGSGDPYFLDTRSADDSAPVVRVPHDAASEEGLDVSRVEIVARSLREFFKKAEPYSM